MQLTSTIKPVKTGIIIVYQGATFKKEFVWTLKDDVSGEKVPVDLTGASLQMQLRKSANCPVILDFAEKGYISITSPLEGKFEISIPAEDTALFDFGRGVFQVEVHFPDEVVVRLLEGSMMLSKEVVR